LYETCAAIIAMITVLCVDERVRRGIPFRVIRHVGEAALLISRALR